MIEIDVRADGVCVGNMKNTALKQRWPTTNSWGEGEEKEEKENFFFL